MKARPRIGILYFANAVAYPYVSATLASDERLQVFLDKRYSALAIYLFFWFCAKGLIKNVPDYDGDKRVNVTTSATLSASRRSAAISAAVATFLVYAAVVVPVAFGFVEGKYLIALVWLPAACFQAWRLIRASDEKSSNDMLRDDMFLSVAYLSTLILIEHLSVFSVAVVVVGFAIMLLSDLLRLDTRRKEDFGVT
jgi:4-hydroxybenzoate polyprenyltransferase